MQRTISDDQSWAHDPNTGLGVAVIHQGSQRPGFDLSVGVEQEDVASKRCRDSLIVRDRVAAVVGVGDESNAWVLVFDQVAASVGGTVVDNDDLRSHRTTLGLQRGQASRQQVARVPVDDDDADIGTRLGTVAAGHSLVISRYAASLPEPRSRRNGRASARAVIAAQVIARAAAVHEGG